MTAMPPTTQKSTLARASSTNNFSNREIVSLDLDSALIRYVSAGKFRHAFCQLEVFALRATTVTDNPARRELAGLAENALAFHEALVGRRTQPVNHDGEQGSNLFHWFRLHSRRRKQSWVALAWVEFTWVCRAHISEGF